MGEGVRAVAPSGSRPVFAQARRDVVLTVAIAEHVVEGLQELGESVARAFQVHGGGHPGVPARTPVSYRARREEYARRDGVQRSKSILADVRFATYRSFGDARNRTQRVSALPGVRVRNVNFNVEIGVKIMKTYEFVLKRCSLRKLIYTHTHTRSVQKIRELFELRGSNWFRKNPLGVAGFVQVS